MTLRHRLPSLLLVAALTLSPLGAAFAPPALQVAAQPAAFEILGYVYFDHDGDEAPSAADEGLSQVDVRLMRGDKVVAKNRTDAKGEFAFGGLAAGTYRVEIALPADHEAYEGPTRELTLGSGGRSEVVTFGLVLAANAAAAAPETAAGPVEAPAEEEMAAAPAAPPAATAATAAPAGASEAAAIPVPGVEAAETAPLETESQTPEEVAATTAESEPVAAPTGEQRVAAAEPEPQPAIAAAARVARAAAQVLAAADVAVEPEPQTTAAEEMVNTEPVLSASASLAAAGASLLQAVPVAEPEPAPEPQPLAASDSAQEAAGLAARALPLRFAEGRDLLSQVAQKTLDSGVVWLGVPFRTQIDGTEFQFVNCGPASLAMVLAGFGLDVEADRVRDYLNFLVDDFNRDNGTSLDALSTIAQQAGLQPVDLYGERGYRTWTTEMVRWHVMQGRPVITLVKYRLLPGHGSSLSNFDHYVVITGVTPTGFIYNDAAFSTTLGYGLEISNQELEAAWSIVSIPRHAVAFALADSATGLSFPERPKPVPAVVQPEPEPAIVEPEPETRPEPVGQRPIMESVPQVLEYELPPASAFAFGVNLTDEQAVQIEAPPSGLLLEEGEPVEQLGQQHLLLRAALLVGVAWLVAIIGWLAGLLRRGVQQVSWRPARGLLAAIVSLLRP